MPEDLPLRGEEERFTITVSYDTLELYGKVEASREFVIMSGEATEAAPSGSAGIGRLKAEFQPPRKGDRHLLPARPEGCFAQKVPVTFSRVGWSIVSRAV